MKLVKEHINFKRGLDPKDAMDIGDPHVKAKRKITTVLDELVKEFGGEYAIAQIGDNDLRGTYFIKKKNEDFLSPKYKYYSFKIEYEPKRENPLTVAYSARGGDYYGQYIDSIEQSLEIIKRWINSFVK